MDEIIGAIVTGFVFVAVLVGLVVLFAFPTMWAVNYLFSPSLLTLIFGVAKFNFLRALVFNFFVGAPLLRSSKKD